MSEFWARVAAFFEGPWGIPLRVVLIVVVAALIRLLLQVVIRRIVNRVIVGVKKKQNVEDTAALQSSPVAALRIVQRTRALGGLLSSTVTTLVVVVALVLIVSAIDPNATGAFSLITAALGAGLGFGAQNVVRDVLNGLFIVSEDQLGVGDVVDLGQATGVVEAVGIRITTVRDVKGTVWYVRNGEILRIGNMSQGWARVILDLPIPYDADLDAVKERMLETANDMRNDPKWRRLMTERPEIWGIESVSAEAVILRLVAKTRTGGKDEVARELRSRMKATLDGMGLRVASLTSVTDRSQPPSTGQARSTGQSRATGQKDSPVIPGVVKGKP
ncbi:MAG: mechanosensitive ion channel domain-containing protein [Pseudolysinimonas sp.]|uniref:mechanosensitive ion channel family protein n=1 Tax=Pseudolysinimonas sp. TaxID=2680009 RepID=UPI003263E28C